MHTSLSYLLSLYNVDLRSSPVSLPGSRHGGLTKLFADLGYKIGAEIGVDRGRYSEEICKANPGVKLYCIDPWIVYGDYLEMRIQDRLDSNRRATIRRLKPYGCEVIQDFSLGFVKNIESNSLDFVYIDGNHEFEYVIQDIIEWSKKVRSGGIVSGHDYCRSRDPVKSPCHVIEAVDAYTKAYGIEPWFLFSKDRCPTWLWVKS